MEPQLIGRDKITAEINRRKATKNAYKSVGIATAYMNQCIQKSLDCGKGNIRTMSERHDKPTALLHQEGNKVGKNMKFATHPFDNYFTTTLFSTYDHLKSQLIELDA